MKKLLLTFMFTVIGFGIAFCQSEVRGVETKRVIYVGEEYEIYDSYSSRKTSYYNEYYGWEFKNRNSIPVSVEIILNFKNDNRVEIVTTKDVVLDPGETYIFKPNFSAKHVHSGYSITKFNIIGNYFVTYKAYKLE